MKRSRMRSCGARFGGVGSVSNIFLLCLFFVSAVPCFSLDREAFSFTNYDLQLQVDPAQHRLGVRGRISLRNDTSWPQNVAVLQVSSSLDWRSISVSGGKAGDKAVQFVMQAYTSDIDHTGTLSEAIVTLPQAVAPEGTVDLDIAYEGVVVLDATRLTRIGTPEDVAESSDWDQIGTDFTALRGAGYVAWYPIATESANLSEGDSLSQILTRWKTRELGWQMSLQVDLRRRDENIPPTILLNLYRCAVTHQSAESVQYGAGCRYRSSGFEEPVLVIADYQKREKSGPTIMFFLRGHDGGATIYADAAEKAFSLITDWFGMRRQNAEVTYLPNADDLPGADAAPFESGALLLTPLAATNPTSAGLAAAHQLTHAAFVSFRPWIEEGLAHFAQALYLEHEKGRQAALDYMGLHRSALVREQQRTTAPRSEDEVNRALVNTNDEELYRSKAMCVWWMLRDMVGDAALKKALAAYRAEEDKDAAYMQRLIAAQTQRQLGWFFDDWVYHDRGLPEVKIDSAYARKTAAEIFLVTITVDNLGGAGAEVPLTVKFAGGTITKRVEIQAKSKVVIRMETSAAPAEITVNDGSVPENDMTNNVFKFDNASAPAQP